MKKLTRISIGPKQIGKLKSLTCASFLNTVIAMVEFVNSRFTMSRLPISALLIMVSSFRLADPLAFVCNSSYQPKTPRPNLWVPDAPLFKTNQGQIGKYYIRFVW